MGLECDDNVGGLADGFPVGGMHLEKSYHHWFTSDVHIMRLTEELEQAKQMDYTHNFFKLSELADLLRFSPLSQFDRLGLSTFRPTTPVAGILTSPTATMLIRVPLLNRGVVIKTNANQHETITSETSAIFRKLAADVEAPVQTFIVRGDIACGSTIGPLTAAWQLNRLLGRFFPAPRV